MRSLPKSAVIFALACVLPPAPAVAQERIAGDLKIEAPWSRATPGGAKVGAGYLKITNMGPKADRLKGVESPIAGRVEIHEMSMDGAIMRMRRVANGVALPPGKTVAFKPGGYHLMFRALTRRIEKGKPFKATLTFQNAGKVALEFAVEGIGAMRPASAAAPPNEAAPMPKGSH